MASDLTTAFVPVTISVGPSGSSTINPAGSSTSSSQGTPSTTQFSGPRAGQVGGPPPWIGSAIQQYQASLNSQNATSSPTSLTISTISSSSSNIASPAAASASPPSTAKASGGNNDRVKIGVSIAFGVSLLWLISALIVWRILRKRHARRRKEVPSSGHESSSSYYSTSHPCACQCHEVEGSPGMKREELHHSHRVEMKGSLGPSRTELPA
ncbi:MAG: hypothetical protein LQ339_003488 [Xanthoria mediterranea]|nr:MAG: hypothetical protein LQ339_003488 [Xanthoria mediterranea]